MGANIFISTTAVNAPGKVDEHIYIEMLSNFEGNKCAIKRRNGNFIEIFFFEIKWERYDVTSINRTYRMERRSFKKHSTEFSSLCGFYLLPTEMCMCSHLFVGVCVQSLRSGGHREHVNDLSNFVELSEDEAVVREQQKKNAD